jgi:1-acyl-sn-glycerol-3-phosphate acyltransferase
VLLIGNHPNDLPDVLLGYATTTRPLRYVATISAATNPVARWVYRGLGVVPVARARDVRKMRALGLDITTMNREAASALHQALAKGDAVGVFPEGGVADVPEIGVLRTGVARMVLDAVEAGASGDLTVVPFGVQYEAPRHWGSDVVVAVGEPWSLAEWRAALAADGRPATAVALAERMRHSLRSVTRNSPTWEAAHRRDVLIAATAAATAPRGALHRVVAELAGHHWLESDDDPSVREALHRAAQVARAGGIPTSARDHARLRHAQGHPADADLPPWWRIALWTPVALAGWFVHAPLFRLVAAVADRGKTCRTDHVIRRFVPGVYVVVAWYLLVGAALLVAADAAGVEPLLAVPLFLALPRLGDAAVAWWWRVRGRQLPRNLGPQGP